MPVGFLECSRLLVCQDLLFRVSAIIGVARQSSRSFLWTYMVRCSFLVACFELPLVSMFIFGSGMLLQSWHLVSFLGVLYSLTFACY